MNEGLREFFARYGVRFLCALCGLIVGILFLTIGFWRTLLLLALALLGWLIGSQIDGRWRVRLKNLLRHAIGGGDEE